MSNNKKSSFAEGFDKGAGGGKKTIADDLSIGTRAGKSIFAQEKKEKTTKSYYIDKDVADIIASLSKHTDTSESLLINNILIDVIVRHNDINKLAEGDKAVEDALRDFISKYN